MHTHRIFPRARARVRFRCDDAVHRVRYANRGVFGVDIRMIRPLNIHVSNLTDGVRPYFLPLVVRISQHIRALWDYIVNIRFPGYVQTELPEK